MKELKIVSNESQHNKAIEIYYKDKRTHGYFWEKECLIKFDDYLNIDFEPNDEIILFYQLGNYGNKIIIPEDGVIDITEIIKGENNEKRD